MGPDRRTQSSSTITDVNIGRQLGRYQLIERIGEGGMGAVYRARKLDSSGEAAIKLIKRGMDTDAILRRFHNERRILAALDHPNVAHLLEANATEEGVPYFVMEYLPGEPLTEYCDRRKLTIGERLELFQKICAAVQCAHDIHVIHRDIKPENILVTPDGEPKLLDFGIAKILDYDFVAASQEATLTMTPIMTPRYASPEQARGEPVTPASDIYSLGVLLYELLTGRSPYKQSGRSTRALVELICGQPPDPPSVAIRRTGSSIATAEQISAQRSADPDVLRQSLARGVDAILLTALEKDPAKRYASVRDFSADISRYLEGNRVHARYHRFGVLWRRPKVRAATIFLAVALFVAASVFGYRQHFRDRVPIRPSVAVLGFENLSHQPSSEWLGAALTEMLSTELASGGRLRTVPGELVSRIKMELALPNARTLAAPTLSRLRRSLTADYVILGSYVAIGEGPNMQVRLDLSLQDTRNGNTVTALSETQPYTDLFTLVNRSGAQLRRRLGTGDVTGDSAALRGSIPQDAQAARNYSEGLMRLRAFDTLAARDLLRNAVTLAPEHALSHAALAAAAGLLGYDTEARDEARKALDLSSGLSREERLSIEGRYFETIRSWDQAIGAYRRLQSSFPDNLEYGLNLAAAQTQGGQARQALETVQSLRRLASAANDPRVDLAEAEAALAVSNLQRARAAAQRAAQSGLAQGFRILAARARLLESRVFNEMGDPQRSLASAAESQKLYQAAGHRQGVAWALNDSAGVLNQLGDVGAARASYEEALAVCRTIGDQSCIGTDLDSLGVLRRREGDLHGSVSMHQQALEIRRAVGDRPGIAAALYNLGNVMETLGDLPGARQAASEALQLREQLGQGRTAALTLSRLANIRRRQGEISESLRMNEQAVSKLRAIGDRGGTAMAQVNFGLALLDHGDLAHAKASLEEALAIRRQQKDKNNTAQALAALASVALEEDRPGDARAFIDESIALRQGLGESISLAQSRLMLADILLEQGSGAEAEATAKEAAGAFRAARADALVAEANLALARVHLARNRVSQAREALAAARPVLRSTQDARLRLKGDLAEARLQFASGRKAESADLLDRALGEAQRLGLGLIGFELRLGMAQTSRTGSAQLASDAQRTGFLLIARKAAELDGKRK